MDTILELLRQGRKEEIWKQYCGFLDLSIDEFMVIQRRLLEEQLPVFCASPIGQHLLGTKSPKTLEEFRAVVPFTTYKDYAPFFQNKNEEALPEKPFIWCHTSGTSGEYAYKWIPFTRKLYDKTGEFALGIFILSAADKRGDVALSKNMVFPYTIAPPPYISGIGMQKVLQLFPFKVVPPLEEAVTMGFMERIEKSFALALNEGMDYFFGVTSILLKISERFSSLGRGGSSGIKLSLKPKGVFRLAKALIKSALKRRPLQPRDIWKVKGVICGGTDTSILKKKVTESWGREPSEGYVCTEFGLIAMQAWNRNGLTFYPDVCLWEFISEKDYRLVKTHPAYIPRSYLMNEVQPNTDYVLVGTQFHGGALVRYILGDLIRFISLEDSAVGIRLPQMIFVSRVDGLIDVGGFTRLTEKTIWQAIENSGTPYREWTIRKEATTDKPILHLYIELREEGDEKAIAERIHASLKELDQPYRELEELAGLKPLRVTILSKGTFMRYFEERQATGADLSQMKPPHMNASDKVLDNLVRMSQWKI